MVQSNFKDIIARSPCVFIIGVCGDSGSGKTTFTNVIREIFGEELVSTITLDDYHLLDREARKKAGCTPLNPGANNIVKLEQDVAALKKGQTIGKMHYNHKDGLLEGPFPFSPTRIIILEGLHTLFTPGLRELIDFSLFVDPDKEVKYGWKRKRDVAARGYLPEEVEVEISQREADYVQYIAPQRAFADAVIRIEKSSTSGGRKDNGEIFRITLFQVALEKRIADISLNIDIFPLLSMSDRDFILGYSRATLDGRKMGALAFDGELPEWTVERLEQSIGQQTRISPLKIFKDLKWVTATEITQLILAWRIINRRIFIEEEWNGCPRMESK